MPINFVGNILPTPRVLTGWHSFDRAFENPAKAEIGLPLRCLVEIYGQPMSGKTTVATALAGLIANQDPEHPESISIGDIEGTGSGLFGPVLEYTGYTAGDVFLFNASTDEDNLDEMLEKLESGKASIGLLDSLGAISPIAEKEGSIGDAVMGRRAKIAATFSRKSLRILRDEDHSRYIIFFTNHVHQIIGGLGTLTPGGDAKKYACKVRIGLKKIAMLGKKKIEIPDNVGWIVEGTVAKNSFGVTGRQFHLFVRGGKGVDRGMTAVMDCIYYGLADLDRTVKIGNKSFGYLRELIEPAADFDYSPFFDALKNFSGETSPAADDAE